MSKFNQIFCATISSTFMITMGFIFSWPSYTAEIFMSDATPLTRKMTSNEISLIGGLPCMGALVMTPVTGIIMDKIGRKVSGIIFAIPYILTWLIIMNTDSVPAVLVAMFISGMSMGTSQTLLPIFLSEISENSIRGFMTAFPVFGYSFGTMISYVLGAYCSYMNLLYIQLAVAVFLFLMMFYVRETPTFYLIMKKEKQALKSLAFYRNASIKSPKLKKELEELKKELEPASDLSSYRTLGSMYGDTYAQSKDEKSPEKEELREKLPPPQQLPPWKIILQSKSSQRALALTTVLLGCSFFMGLVSIQVYAGTLFAKTVPEISPDVCSIFLGVVLTTGCVVAMSITDKLGRRILMIASCIGCFICMATIGALIQTDAGPKWVIPILICSYCFIYNLGGGTIPLILVGEVFLPELMTFTSVVILEISWALNFSLIMVFTPLTELLQIHGIFYFFSFFCLLTAVLTYFFLPETKGITVHEIQDKFYRKKRRSMATRLSIGGNCIEVEM